MTGHERMTISVPTATKRALEDLAEARKVSVSAAAKRVMGWGLMVEAYLEEGGSVSVNRKNGDTYELSNSIPISVGGTTIHHESPIVKLIPAKSRYNSGE